MTNETIEELNEVYRQLKTLPDSKEKENLLSVCEGKVKKSLRQNLYALSAIGDMLGWDEVGKQYKEVLKFIDEMREK